MDNATPATTPATAPATTPAKARKSPEPMMAYICNAEQLNDDEGNPKLKFDVLRRCPADPKAIKAAVKELGHGTYTIITGRLSQVVFTKVESDRIVM